MPLWFLLPVLGMMLVGTVLTGYGLYAQGQAQSAAAKYEAEVARRKAQEAKIQAQWASYNAQIAKGETAIKVNKQEEMMRQLIGAQRAAAGKSGVTGKSLLDVELETAGKALSDLEIIKWSGDVDYLSTLYTGQRYKEQSSLYTAESGMKKSEAGAYSALGGISAGASLLKGFAEAGMYAGTNWPKKE